MAVFSGWGVCPPPPTSLPRFYLMKDGGEPVKTDNEPDLNDVPW